MENNVTISIQEYNDLKRSSKELQCLHEGGVDNWEWYSDSLEQGGYFDEYNE